MFDPYRVGGYFVCELWALPTAINFVPCGDINLSEPTLRTTNDFVLLSVIRKNLRLIFVASKSGEPAAFLTDRLTIQEASRSELAIQTRRFLRQREEG